MTGLFDQNANIKQTPEQQYTAKDIEVLEGLEPVRMRPGMYIGGTDKNALHHLLSEVFDNSMDEVVAGHASFIEVEMLASGSIMVRDNGRGIPIDPHPKFPNKSALEVILTTLHAGGKFNNKAYQTSGGLHGVGISVVNALSEMMEVEVTRSGKIWRQNFSKGVAQGDLATIGEVRAKHSGTKVTFHPDHEIFDKGVKFDPERLYKLLRSKAYLHKGLEIRWKCDPTIIPDASKIPNKETIKFARGIVDFLNDEVSSSETVTSTPFSGEVKFDNNKGRVEWAVHWVFYRESAINLYCNTIFNPQGGTHETGLKSALTKALKEFGELVGEKKSSLITSEDILGNVKGILSLFISNPQFQGQTKDKLSNREVIKLVENAVKDHFDHWLTGNKEDAKKLLSFVVERANERISRRQQKEISRKSPVQKLRLPGKLADCSRQVPKDTEIFLVEGDSAGGSAKMARNRETQAILPLRGKILNVVSATNDKIFANQEIADMNLAFGCGIKENYRDNLLRYEKVIIMTDADVDGAHIASLLMSYFYKFMPKLIENGHLYLAQPPLFRVTQGAKSYYAANEAEKDKIITNLPKNKGKIEVGRFKGLGEMTPAQLKETTMNPQKRTLLKVLVDHDIASQRVEELMGKKPELRFKFITEQSKLMDESLKQQLDV